MLFMTGKTEKPSFAKKTLVSALAALTVLAFAGISSPQKAEAKRYHDGYDRIKIVSRFSPNKYIIAPVRPGRHGDRQVRLPNGRWLDCARNCRWTVQKEYLDFWEFQQNPFGPGYLRLNIR